VTTAVSELVLTSFLLRQKPSEKCALRGLEKLSFAVVEHAKITKELEQLIMTWKVAGVVRVADGLLIDQVGLEDHPATGLERLLDLWYQRALQVIEI
jgi:hypothetical protein